MDDLNSHDIYYNNFLLNIKVVGRSNVSDNELTVLSVSINKDNDVLNLGNFYTEFPSIVSDEFMFNFARNLIDNIDNIIFKYDRYIGDDYDLLSKCSNSNLINESLEKIYSEFLEMPKNSLEYLKYCRFLEIYFHGHCIPDSIRKLFLSKHKKSILDFFNIDSKIREEFNCDISELKDADEYKYNLSNFESLNGELVSKEEELKLLNNMINSVKDVIFLSSENDKVVLSIEDLECKLRSSSFFDRNRNEIKKNLRDLKSSIAQIDIDKERKKLYADYSYYSSIYGDTRGIILLFDNLSTEDILLVLEDIYKVKMEGYRKILKKIDEVNNKISCYDEINIDISDLYERLEGK